MVQIPDSAWTLHVPPENVLLMTPCSMFCLILVQRFGHNVLHGRLWVPQIASKHRYDDPFQIKLNSENKDLESCLENCSLVKFLPGSFSFEEASTFSATNEGKSAADLWTDGTPTRSRILRNQPGVVLKPPSAEPGCPSGERRSRDSCSSGA